MSLGVRMQLLLPVVCILSTLPASSEGRLAVEGLQPKTSSVGKSVAFLCTLAEGRNARFTWTKNGILLHDDARIQIVNLRRTSTLNIDDVEVSDRGVYTCTANDADSEDRQSTTLSVEERVRVEALTPKRTAAGRRVTFTCTAYEGDSARFSWTRNGKIIQTGSDRFDIATSEGSSMLTIKSVTSEDSGDFTCIASNEGSEDRSTAYLTVEGRLSIEPLQAKTAAAGQSVVLHCVLAKGRSAKFTWSKNGLLLHEDARVQIINLRRTSTLNIDDVESSDRGAYTCTAADEDSEDRQSANLTVEGKCLRCEILNLDIEFRRCCPLDSSISSAWFLEGPRAISMSSSGKIHAAKYVKHDP
ncbi:myosin light chain kinase, smooth muscle-like [Galendromus occidentalis]|uniref:Myosin light chain kinase, smooth muscle-like n=1 Tax=Galendromus occidentalis TaxID=34638 RepID=A0AAJ7SH17_9ACAR|nr:myosin light chain kinase, smooth muscle-like [Galendromus occidentalis]